MSPPLSGITILDLSRLLPGPACTMHLHKLGARIIKIEPPGEGDYARRLGLPADAPASQVSPFYELLNAGKRIEVLDFKQPADVEKFLTLAQTADAVLEGFRPGVVDKLGIGFTAVHARNPGIVYASISGYGQTGAWAQRAGHDINYLALSGVLDQIGEAGGPPVLSNVQIADLLGGALPAAMEMLAALVAVKMGGPGRKLDISMTHYAMASNIVALHSVKLHGSAPLRGQDWLTGAYPCYGIYRTADARYLAVGALEQKFWAALCEALQLPHLAQLGHSTGSAALRVRKEVQDILRTRTMADWAALFDSVDACVTPVLTLDEALTHPLFSAGLAL
jgi:alpha-methylacyl-CoA racemase